MLHVIEVPCTGINLAGWLAEMRAWLDHHRIDAATFERAPSRSRTAFRISFSEPTDAMAFAEAFGGEVLRPAVIEDAAGPKVGAPW